MKRLSWRSPFVLVSLVIFAAGAYSTWLRFYKGLGASTNLSDQFPWGLWVGFDVICGVGLAAGGFTICALVHILRRPTYKPLLRPAVLTAFIGYVLVVGGLMFDLGHPWRVWHPLVMWNPHSVMFEIAWCVTLYTTVLAAEVSILFFERFRMERAAAIAHGLAFPLAMAAILLSMLHQSSLGSLFLIVPGHLHAFWYSPMLPLLFFLSAMAGGLAMAIVETNLAARGLGHPLPRQALLGASKVAAGVIALYLVIRLSDMVRSGALLEFRVNERASWFFLLEMVGFILPMILFSLSTVRRNQRYLYRAAQLLVVAFLINRLNVSITGFEVVSGTTYIPAWTEVAVTAMIVTGGVWAVYLAERYLPVVEPDPHATERIRRFEAKAWSARTGPALNPHAPGAGTDS